VAFVTDLEIRPLTTEDDFEAQLDLGQRAFGVYPAQQRESFLRRAAAQAAQGLFLGAFLGGVPAGAAMIYDQRQYWLGRPVRCAGVASVKVAPEHRGHGIGRALMTELLSLMAARGYLVSALYPATTPIYRSLGWELAGAKYQFEVPARSLRALLAPDPDVISDRPAVPPVRRATPDDVTLIDHVIGRVHRLAHAAGPITWDEASQRSWLADPGLYSYLAGPEDGFAAYRWADGSSELFVEQVHAVTPGALRALWSVIASNASVARTVRGWTGPSDPFWWLTTERDATISRRSMWMLRVVDAPGAVAARGFPPAVTASVPLVIRDRPCPANAGGWRLTVADGTGSMIPNGAVLDPDPLTLGPRGLAALYAGIPVHSLRQAGLAAGGSPEADGALDAVFAATPYMVDDF
jgi:predicted acetyltransferase